MPSQAPPDPRPAVIGVISLPGLGESSESTKHLKGQDVFCFCPIQPDKPSGPDFARRIQPKRTTGKNGDPAQGRPRPIPLLKRRRQNRSTDQPAVFPEFATVTSDPSKWRPGTVTDRLNMSSAYLGLGKAQNPLST